jgi:hypothetical protein
MSRPSVSRAYRKGLPVSAKHGPSVNLVQEEISISNQLTEIRRALDDILRALNDPARLAEPSVSRAPTTSNSFEELKRELEKVLGDICADTLREFQRVFPKKRRFLDPRKLAVAEVIAARPRAAIADICREMDRLHERNPSQPKYYPLPSWNSRFWYEVRNSGKVKTFISKIRNDSSYVHREGQLANRP